MTVRFTPSVWITFIEVDTTLAIRTLSVIERIQRYTSRNLLYGRVFTMVYRLQNTGNNCKLKKKTQLIAVSLHGIGI